MTTVNVPPSLSGEKGGSITPQEAIPNPSSAFSIPSTIVSASNRTRIIAGASWLMIVAIDQGTSLTLHLSVFLLVWWIVTMVHHFCFLLVWQKVRQRRLIVSPSNVPSSGLNGMEKFFAEAIVVLAAGSVRYVMLIGDKGNVPAGLATIFLIIAAFKCFWYTLSPEIKAAVSTKEYWMMFTAGSYWIVCMILITMEWFDISPITQTVVAGLLMGYAIRRTTIKGSTFIVMHQLMCLPIATIIFILWWASMLVASNPSWAIVKNNTKIDLLKSFRTYDKFILHPREICTRADIEGIPKSDYPLIFKSNICTTSNYGVRPIFNQSDALDYLENVPFPGKKLHRGGCYTLAQDFVPSKKEFVIFYVRYPYYNKGFIKSIGERGKARKFDINNTDTKHYNKAYFGDYFFSAIRDDLRSEKLLNYLDEISQNFPGGWNWGRIDIKVRDDMDIKNVHNLGILEVNLNMVADIEEKPNGYVDNESIRRINEGIMGTLMPLRALRTFFTTVYVGWINLLMGNLTPTRIVFGVPFLFGRAELCQKNYFEHLAGRE